MAKAGKDGDGKATTPAGGPTQTDMIRAVTGDLPPDKWPSTKTIQLRVEQRYKQKVSPNLIANVRHRARAEAGTPAGTRARSKAAATGGEATVAELAKAEPVLLRLAQEIGWAKLLQCMNYLVRREYRGTTP